MSHLTHPIFSRESPKSDAAPGQQQGGCTIISMLVWLLASLSLKSLVSQWMDGFHWRRVQG